MADRERLDELADHLRRRMILGQIRDEIAEALLASLAGLVGRRKVEAVIDELVDQRSVELADDLLGDDRLAAYDAAIMIRDNLAPRRGRRRFDWPLTPLGQAVAAATVTATSETITIDQAAALLGLSRRKTQKLIKTGRLATDTTGTRPILAAVLDLLADQKARRR